MPAIAKDRLDGKPPTNAKEWLDEPDPQGLLEYLGSRLSARKIRLFAIACCRTMDGFLDPTQKDALHIATQHADRYASDYELRNALVHGLLLSNKVPWVNEAVWGHLLRGLHAALYSESFMDLYVAPESVMGASILIPYASEAFQPAFNYAVYTSISVAHAVVATLGIDEGTDVQESMLQYAFLRHASLLREITGNPFEDAIERIAAVVRSDPRLKLLASHIYTTSSFSLVPFLVHLLYQNGIKSPSVLEHMKAESLHVRGCWLVDAVLGID